MFSLLIKRNGMIDPPEMSELDAHCHLLPAIDDGPQKIEGTLAIARLLVEMGVETVAATPHVISDIYPNTKERILDAADKITRVLKDERISLKIVVGAEYYTEPWFLNQIEKDEILSFGEERYVLFESPSEHKPMLMDEVIYSLKYAGYTPLLAHAERYRFLQGNKEEYVNLSKLGVKFQINHPSFHLPQTSICGETARWLYVKGLVEQLGTDMHRATAWVQANQKPHRRHRLQPH